ncbi:hypothetical protein D3C86_1766520 [compost metagenome]
MVENKETVCSSFFSKSTQIVSSETSQALRSMYIRNVIKVQEAREEARSSNGLKPKFFPPISCGSSAIRILPVLEVISVRYFRVSIVAFTVSIFI